jgi:NitT/TauT family transport system substrate-binding protein
MRFFARALAAIVAASATALPGIARSDETVSIGVVGAASDITLYLAQKKGFFHDEGLTGDIIPFDSGAKMVAPLGAGQLDVGAGAWSAGFFNAVDRGIGIKIVADKATNKAPNDYRVVIVRKALMDQGVVKSLADLKGRKVAVTAAGAGDNSSLMEAMKSVGLGINDVDRIYLGFPSQFAALSNGGIDAAFNVEPDATIAQRKGIAVKFAPYSSFYPVQETGVILFGSNFIDTHRARAEKFMIAFLRAVRFYDGALKGAHLTGPGAKDVWDALSELTKQPDETIFRDMVAPWSNPNGAIDMPSLVKDLANFKAMGDVTADIDLKKVVDTSFVTQAVKTLGPYKATQ